MERRIEGHTVVKFEMSINMALASSHHPSKTVRGDRRIVLLKRPRKVIKEVLN